MPRKTRAARLVSRVGKTPAGEWVFRCHRKGHRDTGSIHTTRKDAEQARASHDLAFHESQYARPTIVPLEKALSDFISYYEELEKAGKKDPKTLVFYRACGKQLLAHLAPTMALQSVSRAHVRAMIKARLGHSGGSRILKEIKTLAKVARFTGVKLAWEPRDFEGDLHSQPRPKRLLDPGFIIDWIAHLPSEDARDFALAKLRTVMREEELRALNVEDVDLENGVIRFVKRAKRKKEPAIQVIAEDLLPVLKRRVKDKLSAAPLFTCRGRRVVASSFRKACIAASKASADGTWTGISPPLTSFGFIRHNVLTRIRAALGLDDAAGFAGHDDGRMIARIYDLDRDKLEAKRRATTENLRVFKAR